MWGNSFFQFQTVIDIPREDRIIPIDYYHYEKRSKLMMVEHRNSKSRVEEYFVYSLHNGKMKIRYLDDIFLVDEIKAHYEYLKLKYA
jgi:hypothetical protein